VIMLTPSSVKNMEANDTEQVSNGKVTSNK